MPDWNIRQWRLDDIQHLIYEIQFCNDAYQLRKWAFLSDYVRIYALQMHGGVYLDSDVEVLSPLEPCLKHDFFIGTEHVIHLDRGIDEVSPECAIMGSAPRHPLLGQLLNHYHTIRLFKRTYGVQLTAAPKHYGRFLKQYGWNQKDEEQSLNANIYVYSSKTFTNPTCPTVAPLAIHHFGQSWVEKGRFYRLCCRLRHPGLYFVLKRLLAKFNSI